MIVEVSQEVSDQAKAYGYSLKLMEQSVNNFCIEIYPYNEVIVSNMKAQIFRQSIEDSYTTVLKIMKALYEL